MSTGDSGYPLRRTLITPILNAYPGTPEENYTVMQMAARSKVERCIGVLKARFRCLLAARALHYQPENAARIVNACCVLHNIANYHNITYEPLAEVDASEENRLTSGASFFAISTIPYNQRELELGKRVLNALVQRLSSL